MFLTTLDFFLSNFIKGTISSTPNWIGTYQMDNLCLITTCCCLTNQVKIFQTGYNQLQVSGSAVGSCTGFLSTITLTLTTPTGFQAAVTWSGQTIRMLLGQDSSSITFVNVNYPYCSATALRTSYNAGNIQSMNLGLIIFILLITIVIMK